MYYAPVMAVLLLTYMWAAEGLHLRVDTVEVDILVLSDGERIACTVGQQTGQQQHLHTDSRDPLDQQADIGITRGGNPIYLDLCSLTPTIA